MHTDTHNIPTAGGSLQLKLWADGNKWWSGMPSKTDTFLKVKSIIAYFNTTSSLTDKKWQETCAKEKTQCEATFEVRTQQHDRPRLCMRPPCPRITDRVHSPKPSRSRASSSSSLVPQYMITCLSVVLYIVIP